MLRAHARSRGWDRLRVIVNAMTRMRFCTPDGAMEFHSNGIEPPAGYVPWYEARDDGKWCSAIGRHAASG